MANRAVVLDGNHGIETKVVTHNTYGHETGGEERVVYCPWYIRENKQSRHGYESLYYTRNNGWERVECTSWIAAFDYIARSRRMLTSHHAGSNYAQEAENAGITL